MFICELRNARDTSSILGEVEAYFGVVNEQKAWEEDEVPRYGACKTLNLGGQFVTRREAERLLDRMSDEFFDRYYPTIVEQRKRPR